MDSFEEIEKKYQELQDSSSAGVVDVRHLLLDIEELVNSPDYQTLALDQRSTLQARRKELMQRIQQLENGSDVAVEKTAGQDQESAVFQETKSEPGN